MYILDNSNYRILKWKLGEPLGYVVAGGHGSGSGLTQISTSYAMFVDNQFNIFVSDYANSRVTKWSPSNTTAGVLVSDLYGVVRTTLTLLFSLAIGGGNDDCWKYTSTIEWPLGYLCRFDSGDLRGRSKQSPGTKMDER